MGDEWPEKWQRVERKDKALRILRELASPSYTPTTTSDLAVNRLEMVGLLHGQYTEARDQLVELGFMIYVWGEPVVLTDGFRGFIAEHKDDWEGIIEGSIPFVREVAHPEGPPIVSAVEVFPSEAENSVFWKRFDDQVRPMLMSIFSASGEVLYVETALQGGRSTGGRYTRPDLTYLVVGRFPLSGSKYLHVISVECKVWAKANDLGSAYEAIAYKRFSTAVYYAFESPSQAERLSSEVMEALRDNGIGVVRLWRKGSQDRWSIDLEPTYSTPAPARLEAHLENLREIDEAGITKLLHSKYR